jgi:hypothetical protein
VPQLCFTLTNQHVIIPVHEKSTMGGRSHDPRTRSLARGARKQIFRRGRMLKTEQVRKLNWKP